MEDPGHLCLNLKDMYRPGPASPTPGPTEIDDQVPGRNSPESALAPVFEETL